MKDTRDRHFTISIVKSGARILAAVLLILGDLVGAGLWLVLAEILGIVEEL